jgi:hypothetical protein
VCVPHFFPAIIGRVFVHGVIEDQLRDAAVVCSRSNLARVAGDVMDSADTSRPISMGTHDQIRRESAILCLNCCTRAAFSGAAR